MGNPEPKKSSLRERILALITEKRITPSDPTHDVLLGEVEIVEELDRLLRLGPEAMRRTITDTQAEGLVKIHQYLTKLQETAVKQQEHSIAQSVARLLQHSRSQEELASWQTGGTTDLYRDLESDGQQYGGRFISNETTSTTTVPDRPRSSRQANRETGP